MPCNQPRPEGKRENTHMKGDLIKAIVILPGTALVYVPGAILWLSAGSRGAMAPPGAGEPGFWIGIVLAVAGFAMAVWTVHLFVTAGAGTPAPWAPPKKLVVRGPYRYVRNPMLLAVSTMLAAESFLFGSWYLAVWTAFFILLNAVYFASIEEPELEKRFGESYRLYKVNQLVIELAIEALDRRQWPESETEIRVARASLFSAQALARGLIADGREQEVQEIRSFISTIVPDPDA